MQTFDAIVIGTGQAGPALAGRLASAGMRVAVVERKRFGGSCVNTGCTPTKALVASAHAAWMARRSSEYGIEVDSVRVDMAAVKKRKDRIVAKSRDSLERWLREDADGVTVFDGHARFAGPRRVEVGDTALSADRVFLNVGARARVPDIPGLAGTPFLTNSGITTFPGIPGSGQIPHSQSRSGQGTNRAPLARDVLNLINVRAEPAVTWSADRTAGGRDVG